VTNGWSGTSEALMSENEDTILDSLLSHQSANQQQINSWRCSIKFLKQVFEAATASFYVIFEYELPREGGRRPDIIILADNTVIIIEVKDKVSYNQSDLEQLNGYYRDIKNYHFESRDRTIINFLLLLRDDSDLKKINNAYLVSQPSHIRNFFIDENLKGIDPTLAKNWLNSDYEPLPSLIDAAKLIFQNEPLPHIKQVEKANIPQTVAKLFQISKEAEKNKEFKLALVSGIPGSGKTLVGLQFVHEFSESDNTDKRAVYLSGNGPLVEVMQYALKSKVFVQNVHSYIRQYAINTSQSPVEHVVIFDEGQRAWDQQKMETYWAKRSKTVEASEPDLFVEIVAKDKDWGVIICLVGDGQEIHTGEEWGIGQWNDAIKKSNHPWQVYEASKYKNEFSNSNFNETPELDLNLSLRSHVAEKIGPWVEAVISGNDAQAKQHAEYLIIHNFYLYITDNLQEAKDFLHNRYDREPLKTYGLIASSKSKNLERHGLNTGYISRQVVNPGNYGPWYYDEDYNKGKTNRKSRYCRDLSLVVTEFGCQGLELDGVLLAWGEDFYWSSKDKVWHFSKFKQKTQVKNPYQLRKNSYRVLLSRARDGIIVFCSADDKLKDTYKYLIHAGFKPLSESVNSQSTNSRNNPSDPTPRSKSASNDGQDMDVLEYFDSQGEFKTSRAGLYRNRRYSRREAAAIFEPQYDFKPSRGSWGLSGIIRLKDVNGYVFFVTLDKSQVDGFNYRDVITKDGHVIWETQNQHHQNSKLVKELIDFNPNELEVHLFVRKGKTGIAGQPEKYIYLGKLCYIDHDKKSNNPVKFEFELLFE
jgi:hypothetical protein